MQDASEGGSLKQQNGGGMHQAVDSLQQRLVDYACGLNYEDLTPQAIAAAKLRIIDTLGGVVSGFFGEPCRIARTLAATMPNADGATVIGTRIKTAPDLAAFANATTARYVNYTDTYNWPGSYGGHPSDAITPVLAAAEHARASGREFIVAVVLAYEVFSRFSDVFHNKGYDYTTLICLASAVGAGKLFGLKPIELAHCISMAVVPNNILRQVRTGHLTMWKAVASGQAGRAGVFAALLARAGMEGPHLPFEGKAGWCEHVARERVTLGEMGGNGVPFRVESSVIKTRPAVGLTIASILAAEKLAPMTSAQAVQRITVEVYGRAKIASGTGAEHWNPESAETADHSIPYVVAAALIDGTVTPHSYDEAHLWNPELRALMQKIEVVENPEYTQAYQRLPVEQWARVTLMTSGGDKRVAEARFGKDGAANPEALIADKFRSLSADALGAKRTDAILERLLRLEELTAVDEILSAFVID